MMKDNYKKIREMLQRYGYKTNDAFTYVKTFRSDYIPDIPISGQSDYTITYKLFDLYEHQIHFRIEYEFGSEWGIIHEWQFLNNPFNLENHARTADNDRIYNIYQRYYE